MDSRGGDDVLQVGLNADAGCNFCLVEEFENRLLIRPALVQLGPRVTRAENITLSAREEASVDQAGNKTVPDRLVDYLGAGEARVIVGEDAQSLDLVVIAGAFAVDELFELEDILVNRGSRFAFDS